MQQFVEPRIRVLVADHLGVRPEELTVEVSLVDELAADSLDMVELTLAVEDAFDISIPERVTDHIRTFGDLLSVVAAEVAHRREEEFLAQAPVPMVRARLVPRDDRRHRGTERTLWLTPYGTELLIEEALNAGSGARLELVLDRDSSETDIGRVNACFSRLRQRGIAIDVRRADPPGAAHPNAA